MNFLHPPGLWPLNARTRIFNREISEPRENAFFIAPTRRAVAAEAEVEAAPASADLSRHSLGDGGCFLCPFQPFLLSSRRDCRVQGSIQAEQISGLQSPYFALR
jgi:hypothetical protein